MDELPETLPHAHLPDALAGGATVVTATRRLARTLRLGFATGCTETSWTTPEVLPWAAWLQATYRALRDFGQLGDTRACLEPAQSAALWGEVLAADGLADSLLMPSAAAEGFAEAWQLAHDWQLAPAMLAAQAGEDSQSFLRLQAEYRRRLDARGFVDGAQLPGLLATTLAGQPGAELVLAGFERLTPAQQALAKALGSRARRSAPPGHAAAPATLAAFPDEQAELAAAADWARERLSANPRARLGIVVPELEARAARLEDLLDEALVPARLFPGTLDEPRPWNISLGQPLGETPVVAAALLCLCLARESLEPAEAGRWLRSPFTGGASAEAGTRARLDAWLRQHAGDRIASRALLGWLGGRGGAPACPALEARVQAFLDALKGPLRRPPSGWSQAVTRALRAMGWPGDAALDSATWQAVQAWAELLETFARLDVVLGPVTLAEGVARLRRLAATQRFQPETPELPVQVLGLLETAGLEFDGVWVTGMHDGILPAPLRPNPLLPAALQRALGMPRACPDTELVLARRLITRLAAAAPEVRFSYPEAREDEPLRPSPVVAGFAAPVDIRQGAAPSLAARAFAARRLEALEDARAPPIDGEVSGGSALLAAQSACPFMAFAVHRLAAEPLETPAAGIDPRQRGQFVHEALSELWGELGNRASLAALSPEDRAAQVRAVLARVADRVLAGLPEVPLRIESDEAALRIDEWLEIEMQRPEFTVIERERRVPVSFGALRLSGRVDRVDRVAGGLVVIDYKTGDAKAAAWEGERPAEPQMPAYALAYRDELAGIAYASLKPGKVGLQGIARDTDVFGPLLAKSRVTGPDDWPARLEAWREVLEGLAAGFCGGDARVDPKQPQGQGGTCARCHLATLCRRDEWLQSLEDGDE
jgi:ATP-dependent helicase/nuclease subunit B